LLRGLNSEWQRTIAIPMAIAIAIPAAAGERREETAGSPYGEAALSRL